MSNTTHGPFEPATFSDGKTTFRVCLDDSGELVVAVIGKGNRCLLVMPRSNSSIGCFGQRALQTPPKPR